MSDRGHMLVSTIDAVLSRARDLRKQEKLFHSYRVYRDARASTFTILFLRKTGALEELDFADVRKLHSLAGVITDEADKVFRDLKKKPGFDLSGRRVTFHPEDDDDLYLILSQVAGDPLETVE